MNKFTEQFRAFVDKMKETNLKETLIHNKRYIGVAAILVILLVVIAIGFNGDKKRNSKNQQETQNQQYLKHLHLHHIRFW